MKSPEQLPLKATRRRYLNQPIHSKWHEVMQLVEHASRAEQWHLHMLPERTGHQAGVARQGLKAYAAKHGYTIELWTDEELAYVKARIVGWPKSQGPRPVPAPEVKAAPVAVPPPAPAPAPAATGNLSACVNMITPGRDLLDADAREMWRKGYRAVFAVDRSTQVLVWYEPRHGGAR